MGVRLMFLVNSNNSSFCASVTNPTKSAHVLQQLLDGLCRQDRSAIVLPATFSSFRTTIDQVDGCRLLPIATRPPGAFH